MYDGRLSVAVWVLITLWARWRISTVANASHLLAAAVTYTFHLEAGQPLGQALRREGLAIYSNTPSFEITQRGVIVRFTTDSWTKHPGSEVTTMEVHLKAVNRPRERPSNG